MYHCTPQVLAWIQTPVAHIRALHANRYAIPFYLSSYLLTGSEISHGLISMSDNTEHYHRSSNKRLFNNLKDILHHFNGILKDSI